jgi:glycerol-3-phosphate acyltransferase PlsY
MDPVIALLATAIGYLCGSISFARLVGRLVAPEKDVTRTEFTVPGVEDSFEMKSVSATSISTQVGAKFGCLTSVMDMLKVTLPTLVFRLMYPGAAYFLLAAAMGVVGHNWPLYHRFKGGRGMSAVIGGLFVVDWIGAFATNAAGMLIGLLVFRDVLLAYTGGLLLLVPWLWFRTRDWTYVGYALVINLAFWLAMIPELKQYIKFKREGNVDLVSSMRNSDMGRGLLKMANRLGLMQEET